VLTNAASGFAYGSTDETRFGIASVALDLPYEKPDRTLPRVLWWTFIALIGVFLIGIGLAWRARNKPRKGGVRSAILLWVPPLAAGALALALVFLLPRAFGGTFGSAMTFFPDIALVIGAVAVLALVWALAHVVSGLVRPRPA
jgi:vacuolar-type H+-ATPase subunit I/STV1